MRALLLVLGFILLNKIVNTRLVKDANEGLSKVLFGERNVSPVKKNAPVVQTASFKKAKDRKLIPGTTCKGKEYLATQ